MTLHRMLNLAALVAVLSAIACAGDLRSAEDCVSEFSNHSGPSDTLLDPLLACPRNVDSVLIRRFAKLPRVRQRLVLLYFGMTESPKAKSLLVRTVLQEDDDLLHGDALVSLAEIDVTSAKDLAKRVEHVPGYLGRCAQQVLSGQRLEKRSRFKAWLGYHD